MSRLRLQRRLTVLVSAPSLWLTVVALTAFVGGPAHAQVNATVNVSNTRAVVPLEGFGIHTSTYDGSLQFEGSPVFSQLDQRLDEAGITTLRYPGGGYADIFHFSHSRETLGQPVNGFGYTPWGGNPNDFGWMEPKTDFGNFVKLLDATNSQTIITVNTGAAMKFATSTRLDVPDYGGQAEEAAAWVAYANADPGIYGTAQDIDLGVDQQGNDWKTAGYWAKLRASSNSPGAPDNYQTWATADGVYDSNHTFLAIDRDEPVGITYWEVGNETFGTGYYTGGNGYALNYAVPYDGTNRYQNPPLSPAVYGQQVNEYVAAMKAVDPDIQIGAVLATPPGDYDWSYIDSNFNGEYDVGEQSWNDQVLAQAADNVDFVIVHWYPGGGNSTILNAPRLTIPQMINGSTPGLDFGPDAGLRDSIAQWRTDGNGNALQIMVTETDGGGNSQSVDGLFAADEYVTFLEHGVANIDWLELHSSFLDPSTNQPDFAYFGIQSAHMLAGVGDALVDTTTSESDVRIHSAVQDDGTVAVMILNMNSTFGGSGTRTVNVSINGPTLSEDGVRYTTDGDSPLASTNLNNLGNSFSTTINARTLQLFLIPPAAVVIPGDCDGDGDVDLDDYNVLSGNMYTATGNGASDGDFNDDGFVNFEDFVIQAMNFGDWPSTDETVSELPGVPEPTVLALLLIGAAAWRRRPR